jgi:hypothetical protein
MRKNKLPNCAVVKEQMQIIMRSKLRASGYDFAGQNLDWQIDIKALLCNR